MGQSPVAMRSHRGKVIGTAEAAPPSLNQSGIRHAIALDNLITSQDSTDATNDSVV